MDNISLANKSLDNIFPPVPIGALAFAPLIILGLVAAVVSNVILLALVLLACVRKFNNNINIYLFSFAIGGLVGSFEIFCLLTVILARRWILGPVICSMNWYATILYNILFFTFYLVVSRDKLKVVKDPLRGHTTKKRAYIYSMLMWAFSLTFATFIAGSGIRNISVHGVTNENFWCFGRSSIRINNRFQFILSSFLLAIFWFITTIFICITLYNFIRILIELRKLKKLRQRFAHQSHKSMTVRVNGQDKPLYRTGEERTAKSLTLVYFIQMICIFISYSLSYTQIIRNFVLPPEIQDSPNFQIYFIVELMIQFFPCLNPIFLIATNSRLRGRVKGLFKCTLDPENEVSPTHLLAQSGRDMSTLVGGKGGRLFRSKTTLSPFHGVRNKIAPTA